MCHGSDTEHTELFVGLVGWLVWLVWLVGYSNYTSRPLENPPDQPACWTHVFAPSAQGAPLCARPLEPLCVAAAEDQLLELRRFLEEGEIFLVVVSNNFFMFTPIYWKISN